MLFRPLVRCVGRPFPACQRGIRVRSYRFEKRCACFPGEGGKGEEKFKNEGRNEPRRGETLVKFYSIPPSPRERNSIVLPRLFANRINKQRKIQGKVSVGAQIFRDVSDHPVYIPCASYTCPPITPAHDTRNCKHAYPRTGCTDSKAYRVNTRYSERFHEERFFARKRRKRRKGRGKELSGISSNGIVMEDETKTVTDRYYGFPRFPLSRGGIIELCR